MQQREPSASESYFWPSVWAIGLHVLVFALLFVSFAMTPELPPSKPIVQATLYQLKSKSQATTQTNQKIAGEAKKTASRQTEVEQLEQKKVEQEAVKAAEQKKADAAQKAEEAREAAEAKKPRMLPRPPKLPRLPRPRKPPKPRKPTRRRKPPRNSRPTSPRKRLRTKPRKPKKRPRKRPLKRRRSKPPRKPRKRQPKRPRRKQPRTPRRKRRPRTRRRRQLKRPRKRPLQMPRRKKAQEAARKAAEDKKAQALAELLSDTTERQQALADEQGDQVAGDFDDLIRMRAAEGWARPPSARKGMTVVLQINMLPDGTITSVSVARSSGDGPYDSSAVAAVKNIGRLTEMQGMKPSDFNQYRSFKMTFTPEDLAL